MSQTRTVPQHERGIALVLLVGLTVLTALLLSGNLGTSQGTSVVDDKKEQIAHFALPDKAQLLGGWQFYPADRIYEKIDGRAAIFHEYGVVNLQFATISIGSKTFDVYAYQMGDTDGALGIYLAEASETAQSIDLGLLGDQASGIVRVLKDRTYLVILALEAETDSGLQIALAKHIADQIKPAKTTVTAIIDLFPQTGRNKQGFAYNKDHTYGLQSLSNIFTCSYTVDGLNFDYLIKQVSPDQAKVLLAAVADEIREFDGVVNQSDDNSVSAETFSKRLHLRHFDGYVCGVYGDLSPDQMSIYLDQLIQYIRSKRNAG